MLKIEVRSIGDSYEMIGSPGSWRKKYPGAVFVFDFDGVLISNRDEKIYQLDEFAKERSTLNKYAIANGINSNIYETQYLRHLVYQDFMLKEKILPEPGPFLSIAKELSDEQEPFFILTARSGVAAIKRAQMFIETQSLTPQEIFFIGRVPKGRQLELLADELEGRDVIYIDDSKRHARNSSGMNASNLVSAYVNWSDEGEVEVASAYKKLLKEISEQVSNRKGGARGGKDRAA